MRAPGISPQRKAKRPPCAGVLLALVLVLIAGACLCGCRPTDFFTEVVISPFAENVDQNNAEKTIVNSPDATKTSDQLSSLSWKSNAKRSKEVEKLVTYSKKPTSTLNTHHSNYSTNPRFKGIKSSDPVQLEFGSSSKLKKKKSDTTSSGTDTSQTPQNKGTQGKTQNTSSKNSGASDSGTNKTKSHARGTGTGPNKKKNGGGLKGTVKVYDPNNALSNPPKADHVAAIGQAAVLVQAIGGKGALAAMDRQTYSTKRSSGAVSFAQVFSDELSSGFASKALLWTSDGTTPSSLSSVDKLVSACGKNGVVVYDQNEVDPNGSWFTKAQRKVLQAANITFVPVSFTSVSAMKDAATVVGKVLSKTSNADDYCDALDEVMQTAKAAEKKSAGTVYTAIATDYVRGISYAGRALRTQDGLLFTRVDAEKLLATWCSNVGVNLKDASDADSKTYTYDALWGIKYGANFKKSLFTRNAYTSSSGGDGLQIASGGSNSTVSGTFPGHGLGSSEFPYLIVSASGSMSAEKVRSSVVREVESYATSKTITPYSALPSNSVGREPNTIVSTVGSSGSDDENLLYGKTGAARKCVRANPSGLLGSWTQGSVESVLETVWLARIYSGSPTSAYEPIDSLGKDELKSAILKFYKTAYRYDASRVYGKVVTDEGIG